MREESHIDDMRAAIRGDRERAKQARQRSTENVHALIVSPEPDEAPASEPEPDRGPRKGVLGRLFGR